MADEAHRGQYGLAERIKITTNEEGEEIAKRVVGTARIIRNSLPNATYIGFTGTRFPLRTAVPVKFSVIISTFTT